MKNQKILRMNEVVEVTGLSISTIKRLEQNGQFPKKRKLSTKAIGWLSDEVMGWIKSKGGQCG